MKNTAAQQKTSRIVIGVVSLVVLAVLALRFPALPEQVPIQFGFDGTVSNSAPRLLFAIAVAAGILGFNSYVNWFRDREQPLRIASVLVFLLLCGAVLFSLTR